MALANYTDLQAAVASWNWNRTDIPVTDVITLAEARLRREIYVAQGETEAALTAVVDSRYIALPTGFTEPVACFIDYGAGRQHLNFIDAGMDTVNASGPPTFWAVDGANIAFERPLDQSYDLTLRYIGTWSLSGSAPTNWLLTNAPDVYLAACGVEAGVYLKDTDDAAMWVTKYTDAKDSINAKEARSKSNRLAMDPAMQAGMTRRTSFNIYVGS